MATEIPVGRLFIEMAADVARVKSDMAQVKSLVGDSMGAVKQSAGQAQQANETLIQSFGFMKTAIGGVGVGLFISQVKAAGAAVLGAQTEVDRFTNRMKVASGGIGDAGRELDYVRGMANRMGLSLLPAMDGYSKLAAAARGTALEGANTRKVFEAVSKASVVMGLSAEQTNGALLALQQMVSKGTVQAEELRGQLGERLPGAFQIAARAMGVSTQELGKMLEQGQVLADEFLPKFANQLDRELAGSTEDASKSAQASLNRFGNAWDDLKIQIANSGLGDAIAAELNQAAGLMDRVSKAMKDAREMGGGTAGAAVAGGTSLMDNLLPRTGPLGFLSTMIFGRQNRSPEQMRQRAMELEQQVLDAQARGVSPPMYAAGEAAQIRQMLAQGLPDQSAAESARLLGAAGPAILPGDLDAGNVMGNPKARADLLSRYRTQDQRRADEMADANAAFGGLVPPEVIAGINEKFKDKGGAREAAKEIREYSQALNEAAGITNDYLPSLTLYQKQLADGKLTQDQYTDAIERLIGKQPISKKLIEEEIGSRNQLAGVTDDYLPTLEKLAHQYEAGNVSLEQYQAAVAALIAKQPSAKRVTDEYTRSMKEQEDARKRNLATQEAQFTAQEQEIGGLAKHAQTLEDANKLLGLNADERFKVVDAQRAMQIQELEYLLIAERSNANDERQIRVYEEKIRYLQKIRGLEQGAFEGAKQEAFFSDMERGITDALMRGFDGGKGIVENFIDTTKNMFATLILRPRIEAMVRYGVTGGASLFGMAPASAAGAGGADGLGMVSNIAGVGGMFGAGGMASYAATGFMNTLTGTGVAQGLTSAGALMANGATGSGIAMGLGSVAPYLAAIIAIYSLLSKGGETRTGGQYGMRDGKVTWLEGPSGGDPNAVSTIRAIETAQQQIYSLVGTLGGSGGGTITRAGYENSKYHDKRFSEIFVNDAGRRYYGETSDFSNEAVAEFFATDLQRAVILGIQSAELDRHFAEYFAQINPFELNAEQLANVVGVATAIKQMTDSVAIAGGVFLKFGDTSVEMRQRVIELTGGMESFNQKFSSYIGNYYSDTEQAQISAAQIQAAMRDAGIFGDWLGNKDQFRWLMDSLDPNSEVGSKQVATLLNYESQFAQLTEFMNANKVTLGDLASQVPDSIAAAIERTTANQVNALQQQAQANDVFSGTVNEFGQYVNSMGESARRMEAAADLMER
ncbi:MAG: tape measure protein, partial [Burkholderiales bacterium]|nr:tape measure protein [Burkholderiales bacterium]